MRQLAYYRTTPKNSKLTRYEIYSKGSCVQLPKINNGEYLLTFLDEMGYAPLSYVEIKAYLDLIGITLHSWEVVLLKKLSDTFLNETYNTDDNAPPPYTQTIKPKGLSAKDVRNAFAGITKKSNMV